MAEHRRVATQRLEAKRKADEVALAEQDHIMAIPATLTCERADLQADIAAAQQHLNAPEQE